MKDQPKQHKEEPLIISALSVISLVMGLLSIWPYYFFLILQAFSFGDEIILGSSKIANIYQAAITCLGIPLGMISVIIGIISLRRMNKSKKRIWIPVVGITLGALAIVANIIFFGIVFIVD